MLLSTTQHFQGYSITDYLGVTFAETILSANVFRDWLAGIVNFMGGRARGYEREMQKARNDVLEKLAVKAREAGANAVAGVRVDYEFLGVGSRGGMLMVTASGTAVRLQRRSNVESFNPLRIGGDHGGKEA